MHDVDAQWHGIQMWSFQEAIVISFSFLAALLALMMFFQTRLVHLRLAREALT